MCAGVQEYHEMFFFFKFFLVLILQSTCLICVTSKRKKAMEQDCTVHVNERNQTKTKQNRKKSHYMSN